MQQPKIKTIKLASITVDTSLQSRPDTDQKVVRDYARAIKGGVKLPPMKVVNDGTTLLLAAGFHRYEAYAEAGVKAVEVEIYHGDRSLALVISLGSNREHNARRFDNKAKQYAIRKALKELPKWSTRDIAELIGVSHTFVANIKGEHAKSDDPASVVGKDGKTYPSKSAKMSENSTGVNGLHLNETLSSELGTPAEAPGENPDGVASEPAEEAPDKPRSTGAVVKIHHPEPEPERGDAWEGPKNLPALAPGLSKSGKIVTAPSGEAIPRGKADAFADTSCRDWASFFEEAAKKIRKMQREGPSVHDGNPFFPIAFNTLLSQNYTGENGKDYTLKGLLETLYDYCVSAIPYGMCPGCGGPGCEKCQDLGVVPEGEWRFLKGA